MSNADAWLLGLVETIERTPEGRLSLTLMVGGSMITGCLIPTEAFFLRLGRLLASGDATLKGRDAIRDLTAEQRPAQPPEFVHLAPARISFAGTLRELPAMRVRLESVTAWAIGEVT